MKLGMYRVESLSLALFVCLMSHAFVYGLLIYHGNNFAPKLEGRGLMGVPFHKCPRRKDKIVLACSIDRRGWYMVPAICSSQWRLLWFCIQLHS